MQVSESLSLNGDHVKEHVFTNELFEEYMTNL